MNAPFEGIAECVTSRGGAAGLGGALGGGRDFAITGFATTAGIFFGGAAGAGFAATTGGLACGRAIGVD
jgi:hypothetical protein